MQRVGGKAGAGVLALAAIVGAGAWLLRSPTHPGTAPGAHVRVSPLPVDSQRLLVGQLAGVSLGMDMTALLHAHPRLKRQPTADRDGLLVFEEVLPDRAHVLYFLADVDSPKLARVQIATELPTLEDVVKRVLDRQQRLGAPAGVWDCPARDGQLPTRRYTFRANSAAAADVYVLLGERALATYYVASANDIRASLELAGCISTPPERATRFPVVPTPAPTAP